MDLFFWSILQNFSHYTLFLAFQLHFIFHLILPESLRGYVTFSYFLFFDYFYWPFFCCVQSTVGIIKWIISNLIFFIASIFIWLVVLWSGKFSFHLTCLIFIKFILKVAFGNVWVCFYWQHFPWLCIKLSSIMTLKFF